MESGMEVAYEGDDVRLMWTTVLIKIVAEIQLEF